jgi:hypothetical protein
MDDAEKDERFGTAVPAPVQKLANELVPLFYGELKRLARAPASRRGRDLADDGPGQRSLPQAAQRQGLAR